MDLNMLGFYSGIDMTVIDQLMEAEAARGVRFTNQKETYTQAQNAWKDLNTRLDSLYNRLDILQSSETFESKAVSLSSTDNFSVSANTNAATGDYRVQVNQLATQTRLTGNQVETASIYDELDINGTFVIEYGEEKPLTIEVKNEDSLRDVMQSINDTTADSGIRANIVNNHLVLSHVEYGELDLSVSGDLADDLGFVDDIEADLGQDAVFTIDGVQVTRSSNTINDAIEGLTFNLTNVHEGNDSDVVSVKLDTQKSVTALQQFVDQYNSTAAYINSQLDIGDPTAEDNETGALVGDGTIMRIQSSLRSMMTVQHESDSESVRSLLDLGIEIDRDGVASFNQEKYLKLLKEDPESVANFFYQSNRVTVTNENGEEVLITETDKSGFAHDMRGLINEYISDSSGIIKNRNETYDRLIKDVNQRIEQFEERLEVKRDRYIRQFSALDNAMMQAESQLDFLYSQIGLNQN